MAKYTLLVSPDGKPLTDPLTGCQWAEFEVTVGTVKDLQGKDVPRKIKARKRIFTDTDQCGGLTDDDLLGMLNYAEDLWVRGTVTSQHTPKGQKAALRALARLRWAQADIAGFTAMVVAAGGVDSVMNERLDAYVAETGLTIENGLTLPPSEPVAGA